MELRQFLDVIWKRLWLILLATVLVAGMTYYLSITTTPIYSTSTTLYIDLAGSDPRDIYSSVVVSERAAKTYVEQMKAPVLLKEVIDRLGLSMSASQLGGMVTVQQVRDTQLIQVSVEDTNPMRGREIAASLAETFIQQNQARQQARYETRWRELQEEIAVLEKSIDETQKAIASIGNPLDPQNVNLPEFARLELTRLATQLSRDQTQYVILLRSQEDFRLAAARYTDNITISSPAETPQRPVKPRTALNTILGLISGVVLGVSTAFLLEYLDDTLKTSEDVEKELGLTTLGNIAPLGPIKELRDGLVTASSPRSPVVEAYRALRTNLRFSSLDNPASTLLVTSAGPREGKSTTAANLGVVMAQAGKEIILVDTDLRHPTLHQIFQVPEGSGLSALLLEEAPDVEAALTETEVKGLRLLTCGPMPPNPAELLGSERMAALVEELKTRADVVLFDSPPVLAVTDATVLATAVGGVVLVVDCGRTRNEVARRVKEALEKVDAHILGVVLNRQTGGRGGYYYYYYYGNREKKRRERKRRK